MKLFGLLTSTFISLATVASADLSGLTPQQLQDQTVMAVTNGDANAVLALMQEMQRRNMLFFEDPGRAGCNNTVSRDLPIVTQTSLFSLGTLKEAYSTYNHLKQMEAGECGCSNANRTFDQFTQEVFGVGETFLTEAHLQSLREYNAAHAHPTAEKYHHYFNTYCRGR